VAEEHKVDRVQIQHLPVMEPHVQVHRVNHAIHKPALAQQMVDGVIGVLAHSPVVEEHKVDHAIVRHLQTVALHAVERRVSHVIHKDAQLMVVGVIGVLARLLAEEEHKVARVIIRHLQTVELHVQVHRVKHVIRKDVTSTDVRILLLPIMIRQQQLILGVHIRLVAGKSIAILLVQKLPVTLELTTQKVDHL